MFTIKYNDLISIIMIESFEEKNNLWRFTDSNSNDNFFKEIEAIFKILHHETYIAPYE